MGAAVNKRQSHTHPQRHQTYRHAEGERKRRIPKNDNMLTRRKNDGAESMIGTQDFDRPVVQRCLPARIEHIGQHQKATRFGSGAYCNGIGRILQGNKRPALSKLTGRQLGRIT